MPVPKETDGKVTGVVASLLTFWVIIKEFVVLPIKEGAVGGIETVYF